MDVQGVSGGSSSFDGKPDHGGAQSPLACEPENANGAFVAVPFVGEAAEDSTREGRNGEEAGIKNGGMKDVSPFFVIKQQEKGERL